MHVTIAKVDQNVFDGEAMSLTVPGSAGEMTILSHHMPIITTLKEGVVVVRLPAQSGKSREEEPLQLPIQSGILEVNKEGATVIL